MLRRISASRAARALKFWLQVALETPIAPRGRGTDLVHPDPGKPDFPEIFFSLFSLLRTFWDLRVTPQMFRYHLIRIRTGKSGFSKIRIFRFFEFLSLKDPTEYYPSKPERAAEARRAVVASVLLKAMQNIHEKN